MLHYRVTALHDAHARFADKPWAIEVEVQRTFGEVAQYIQFRQGGGGVLQRRQAADQVLEQGFVEHLFPRQGAAFGRQRLVFERFELGGDKTLGAFEGLATLIIDRRRLGLFARQLNKVAMHAVVADFQVSQAGAGFFAGFQVDQELPGVFAQRLQLIQLAVVAGFQYAAVTNDRRWVVDDGLF